MKKLEKNNPLKSITIRVRVNCQKSGGHIYATVVVTYTTCSGHIYDMLIFGKFLNQDYQEGQERQDKKLLIWRLFYYFLNQDYQEGQERQDKRKSVTPAAGEVS